MDFYIARQPIFNIHRRLHAYELLYRGTPDATLAGINGERATSSLLSSAFLTEGLDVISGSRPCFINFTEDLLVKRIPLSFPRSKIVIEILEDVRPTREVIEACRVISNRGYTIALDDFIYDRQFEPLIELADIIKIDFRLTPIDIIQKTLYRLKRFDVKLLAEKIETSEDFDRATKMGFMYFQGYFFSKPENIKIKELVAAKINMIQLLAEVTRKSTTLERLQKIISMDVSISYKLLRFLNSAYFYRVQQVKTVKHAIAYLGEKELRRFILLVIVSELSSEKPDELVRQALIRARFCELMASESGYEIDASELFIMGLFSFIDVMLDNTMEQIMQKLPLSSELKAALIHHAGNYSTFLDIIVAYERKQESRITKACEKLGIDENLAPEIYLKALKFANGLL